MPTKTRKISALGALIFLTFTSQAASLNETLARCAPHIDPNTMRSIVTVESSENPYAIGIDTPGMRLARQPKTREEAVVTAQWLHDNGYRYGAGWAQISHRNFERLGLTPENVFDPCLNLQASQKILIDDYQIAQASNTADAVSAVLITLSRYNTGDNDRGFRNGYVKKVVKAATQSAAAPAARKGLTRKSPDPVPIPLVSTAETGSSAAKNARSRRPLAHSKRASFDSQRLERIRAQRHPRPETDVFGGENTTDVFTAAASEASVEVARDEKMFRVAHSEPAE
jgi:type IV secretion system protein VirB1